MQIMKPFYLRLKTVNIRSIYNTIKDNERRLKNESVIIVLSN